MMCNKEVHELLIQEGQVNCIFCNEQIQDPGKPERDFCCDSMRLIKDNFLVCMNCGQVHDYLIADEYIDFYENRYRIKRKSIYYRKYHIINTMNDIAQKNNIQLDYYDRESILRIFQLFDRIELPDVGRKRLISVNYIIKQLFDILGIEYKSISHTQIKNTLKYHNEWWDKVYGYIKDDVNRIILRRHY